MSGSKQREANKCKEELSQMLKSAHNKFCADCGAAHPTWTSTNLGVFICISCSGIHRNMSTEYSFVKSTTLDSWNYVLLDRFKRCGGNKTVNSYYEAKLNKSLKPTEHSSKYQLEQFIRQKYIEKKFYSSRPKTKRSKSKSKKKSCSRKPKNKNSYSGDTSEETVSIESDSPSNSSNHNGKRPKSQQPQKQPYFSQDSQSNPVRKTTPQPSKPTKTTSAVDLISADQWPVFTADNTLPKEQGSNDDLISSIVGKNPIISKKKQEIARNSIMKNFEAKSQPMTNNDPQYFGIKSNDPKFFTNIGQQPPVNYSGAQIQIMQMTNAGQMQPMYNNIQFTNGNGMVSAAQTLGVSKSAPEKNSDSWVGFANTNKSETEIVCDIKKTTKQEIMNIYQIQTQKNTMMTGPNKPVPNNAFMTQLRPQVQPMVPPVMNGYVAAPQGYVVNNGYGNVMMMNVQPAMAMNGYGMQAMNKTVPMIVPANGNVQRYYAPSVNTNSAMFSQFQIN